MFEFTKEERDAWQVIRPLLCTGRHDCTFFKGLWPELDAAADRFDAREETCGIEPLSWEHYALGITCSRDMSSSIPFPYGSDVVIKSLLSKELVKRERSSEAFTPQQQALIPVFATDKGRTVLANLNAMCKVER